MIYLDDLVEITGGELAFAGKYRQFQAFSHDTHQIVPDEMFVAVRGSRVDGHDYLLDAMRKGATGLLVEARTYLNLPERVHTALVDAEITVVSVDNTRLALQNYAKGILAHWKPTVIAVTGSVGKTSTKEAIADVLSKQAPTFRSWQNYNDLLGIPLSLGRLEKHHKYAVLELGGDHPGEIDDLCRMVQPHIGVLTNIRPVLLQYFGSMERLIAEFSRLFSHLPTGGQCFYNHTDDTLRMLVAQQMEEGLQIHFHPFMPPARDNDPDGKLLQTQIVRLGWDGIEGILQEDNGARTKTEQRSVLASDTIDERSETEQRSVAASDTIDEHSETEQYSVRLQSHLLGAHNFSTMLAAYQIGRYCGLSSTEIIETLQEIRPMPGRLNPLEGTRNARILDDTHNASPASVVAGLATLHELTPKQGNRIAVLGDMLSLGSYEEEAHRTVGAQAARFVDYLVLRGERAITTAEAARQAGLARSRIIITSSHEDAAQAVRLILEQSDDDSQIIGEGAGKNVVLIKGSEETRMERVTEMLMAHPWEAPEKLVRQTPNWKKTVFRHADRPTWVEIDLNAIGNNTQHLKELVGPDVQVLASLKADAYGHGAVKVARTVLHNGASMIGVATVSEAVPLREEGIRAPILVFGYIPRWQMREAVRLGVSATLYSQELAQELSRAALEQEKVVKVHVKVDTGMGRLGIRAENIDEIVAIIREIKALPGLELEGLFTHFATADAEDSTYMDMQLARFHKVLSVLDEQDLRPPIVHAANSAATISRPDTHFNMVRPGIAIYGLNPSSEVQLPEGFRPALSFKTQVSQIKTIPAGDGISYGATYIARVPTRIAVLPVGYADGFRRSPQNWGSVLLHGIEAPIVGRVCMDQCMVDITHIPQARMGDEVVLIGRQGEAALTAEMVAQRLGTISYEVVAEILARVPRVD